MNTLDLFIGKYQKQLTLRNSLIPIGETLNNINKANIILQDAERKAKYQKAKLIIDDYHRVFIDKCLATAQIDWEGIVEALKNSDEDIESLQEKKRKEVAELFTKDKEFTVLFGKDLIKKVLPEYLEENNRIEDKEIIESFKDFTTYFVGFWDNRQNIYSAEQQATSIANRVVNINLEKFVGNIYVYETLLSVAPEIINAAEKELLEAGVLEGQPLVSYFVANGFNNVLRQSDIDMYNAIIGGTPAETGTAKIQGINELINLAMQQSDELRATLKSKHATKMTKLYKQILSVSDKAFFIDSFADDQDVLNTVGDYITKISAESSVINKLKNIFSNIDNYDAQGIFTTGNCLSMISKELYGGSEWSKLRNAVEDSLATDKDYKKKLKAAEGDSEKALAKRIISFSYLHNITDENILEKFAGVVVAKINDFEKVCSNALPVNVKSINDKAQVKERLDLLLDILHLIKVFNASEFEKDTDFYSDLLEAIQILDEAPGIYNKVRNYATKKPYSEEKFKLNFENVQLAKGWDKNKEEECMTILMKKDGLFYLGVMNKFNKPKIEDSIAAPGCVDTYDKMVYKLFPKAYMMLPKCTIRLDACEKHFEKSNSDLTLNDTEKFNDSIVITKEMYDLGTNTYKAGNKEFKKFQIEYKKIQNDVAGYYRALRDWIDFAKEFLSKYKSTADYDYSNLLDSKDYKSLDEFYADVSRATYKLAFEKLDKSIVDKWVKEGKLYLFQIYNKDFAEGVTGKKNLHTLYFENIFSDENLRDVVIKLNGEAELFHRFKSIDDTNVVVHKRGSKLVNKVDLNGNTIPDNIYVEISKYANGSIDKLSDEAKQYYKNAVIKTATHDIVKDRRYTDDKFFFHVPITINFKSSPKPMLFNQEVREFLHHNKDVNIIGIDRGERNLIYMTIINQDGKILESRSFNTISHSNYAKVNYHNKLDVKEKARTQARQSWDIVGKIAELKEGYLSAVVHEITEAMVKYNAIIVMEDLNVGFKRIRGGIAEKSVYQKFEKMLIDKLNYLAFKDRGVTENGGVLKGYQLADKFVSFERLGKQCGFIFYVPAAYTSKINPTTGFTNVFNTKVLTDNEKRKAFFASMSDIVYDATSNAFKFSVDLSNPGFKLIATPYRTKWDIYSIGKRIIHKKDNVGHYTDHEIDLTNEFIDILNSQGINYQSNDLKKLILAVGTDKANTKFWSALVNMFVNTLQMRNSSNSILDAKGNVSDYIISPVLNSNNEFFNSTTAPESLPQDADSNGAYHIAMKGLMYLKRFNQAAGKDLKDPKLLKISKEDWFEFIQS